MAARFEAVGLVVRQRDVERALDVAQAGRDAAGIVGGAEAGLVRVGVVRVERIAHAHLEAVHRGRAVHDHVVPAHGVGGAEAQAQVGLRVAGVEGVDVGEVVRADGGLASELQRAPGVVGQPDGGLAAEQPAGLSALPVGGVEAAFQLEHGAQAVSEVFGAAQAPTRTGLDAVDHAEFATVVSIAFDFVVADAGVDDTIESYRRFCLSDACKSGDHCGCEQRLFHPGDSCRGVGKTKGTPRSASRLMVFPALIVGHRPRRARLSPCGEPAFPRARR